MKSDEIVKKWNTERRNMHMRRELIVYSNNLDETENSRSFYGFLEYEQQQKRQLIDHEPIIR